MSPIGRVFIVLNLILAGAFVGFSGTFLQRQHHWKDIAQKRADAHQADKAAWDTDREKLTSERNAFENAKSIIETRLDAKNNELQKATEENLRLTQQLAKIEGDVALLQATAKAGNDRADAAFDQARQAYEMARNDQKAKDEAIRAKDAAEEENRSLKNTIADLNETIGKRVGDINSLTETNNRLGLLVSVAKAKGFLESMAVPALAGTVAHVSGRLCTISITDNPANASPKDMENANFAIYDANGYKGEAFVDRVDAEGKLAFCTLKIVKGAVREGDSASTKTPGTN